MRLWLDSLGSAQLSKTVHVQTHTMSEQSNIRSLFANAKGLHRQLDSWQSTGELYQDHLRTAIATFEECRQLADSVSMFSPNETLDDLSSQNLQFLSIDYYLGELVLKNITPDRRRVLRSSQEALERYLNLLDDYSMLSASDKRLYERYTNNRDSFSLLSSSDASIRRDVKIARFKQEKNLKQKLEVHCLGFACSVTSNVCFSISLKIRVRFRTMMKPCASCTLPSSLFSHTRLFILLISSPKK
jgi:hypothetical protein